MRTTASEPPSAHGQAFCLCVCSLSSLMISKREDYDALPNTVMLCLLKSPSKPNQLIKQFSETVQVSSSEGRQTKTRLSVLTRLSEKWLERRVCECPQRLSLLQMMTMSQII